ncbi:MAG: cyclic pyranopterin monophosphate synthase MoaC [Leptospiraceae bacterium]|nr:cyclic pyranopterin monophosphate synthase MoaC [Leptospiraceae bacterium]
MNSLSHINPNGRPAMVDVSSKAVSNRSAHARCQMQLPPATMATFNGTDFDNAKGAVINTAIIAGTLAAKNTAQLIPLCHPLPLEDCQIAIEVHPDGRLDIDCRVKTSARTGVEMEAITGANLAAICLYDMLKATSPAIEIRSCYLVSKTGGKRDYQREAVHAE